MDELIEALASEAHAAWSGWMDYLFSKSEETKDGEMIIPKWAVERWRQQAITPYADLSEEEKESDREEARRYLKHTGSVVLIKDVLPHLEAEHCCTDGTPICNIQKGDYAAPLNPENCTICATIVKLREMLK